MVLLLSHVIACATETGDGEVGTETGTSNPTTGPATTVHVRSANAPLLVVFRDGPTAAWQPATQLTANQYTAAVHGPYMVGVVCQTSKEVTFDGPPTTNLTWETARTLADSTDLVPPCVDQVPVQGLSGTTTPGATVQSGTFTTTAQGSGLWISFAEFGTRDVIVSTSDRILIQRDFELGFGTPPVPTLDVAGHGTLFVPVFFDLPNLSRTESVRTEVRIQTASTAPAAPLSSTFVQNNGVQEIAFSQAMVAPTSVLSRPDDQQVITLTGVDGIATRSLSRGFELGGDSDFVLPDAVADAALSFNATTNQDVASWSALPVLDSLDFVIHGATASPAASAQLELHMTAAFIAATKPTSAAVDTQLPGFQAAWQLDVTQAHTRSLSAVKLSDGAVATSGVNDVETVVPTANHVAAR